MPLMHASQQKQTCKKSMVHECHKCAKQVKHEHAGKAVCYHVVDPNLVCLVRVSYFKSGTREQPRRASTLLLRLERGLGGGRRERVGRSEGTRTRGRDSSTWANPSIPRVRTNPVLAHLLAKATFATGIDVQVRRFGAAASLAAPTFPTCLSHYPYSRLPHAVDLARVRGSVPRGRCCWSTDGLLPVVATVVLEFFCISLNSPWRRSFGSSSMCSVDFRFVYLVG